MLISLLIILLSGPGEPVVFGVMGEFRNQSECWATVREAEMPDEMRRKLSCIEVRKPRDA
ncbi:hypothetical protein ACHMW6_06105 [Pseudoduganella sp. UC29_106]|uniref:hypothetical protein n=1 Tax=Pseudoduganella sp. UC29_106 TaxID=3374553 RepID=UPI0037575C12